MASRGKLCDIFILASILILSKVPLGQSQSQGCSLQGLHLDKCLSQDGQYVFLEPCCNALNQAVRNGFHCLCTIFANSAPQFGVLISLSISSCYLMVPPMTMCRDLAAMPISLPVPPYSPAIEQHVEPSVQENQLMPLPPPPQPTDFAFSPASNSNTTLLEKQQVPSKPMTSKLHVLKSENSLPASSDASKTSFCCNWLLSLAVFSLVLVV